MTKYKYNKISSIRTFEESPAKWFMVDGVRHTRKDTEQMPYADLRRAIKSGKVMSVQVVK